MDPAIVGSLLLSKVEVNYPFMVKAKSLYAIEYLVKKNPTFLKYFKSQSHLLSEFPTPEDNADNYKKILKNLLNVIGVPSPPNQQSTDNPTITFVDPGYNNIERPTTTDKPKQANNNRKFISPTDAQKKKVETNDPFDIFSNDVPQRPPTTQPTFENINLLGDLANQNNFNNITFDALLKGEQQKQTNYMGFTL
jgi:hypothetical protein